MTLKKGLLRTATSVTGKEKYAQPTLEHMSIFAALYLLRWLRLEYFQSGTSRCQSAYLSLFIAILKTAERTAVR